MPSPSQVLELDANSLAQFCIGLRRLVEQENFRLAHAARARAAAAAGRPSCVAGRVVAGHAHHVEARARPSLISAAEYLRRARPAAGRRRLEHRHAARS
jgi:hypothetical protein